MISLRRKAALGQARINLDTLLEMLEGLSNDKYQASSISFYLSEAKIKTVRDFLKLRASPFMEILRQEGTIDCDVSSEHEKVYNDD